MTRQAPLNAGARAFIVRALRALVDIEKNKLVTFAVGHMKIPAFASTHATWEGLWAHAHDDEQIEGWLKAELSRVAVPALYLITLLTGDEITDAMPTERQILDAFNDDEVKTFAKVYLR